MFLLLHMVVRHERLASILTWVLAVAVNILQNGMQPTTNWLIAGLSGLVILFVLTQFGLLALVSLLFFSDWSDYPFPSDLSRWYGGTNLIAMLIVVIPAVYCCYTTLARKPVATTA